MTQRIFDTDNAEDMALLWSILPEDVVKLTPRDTFCLTSDAYTFRGGIIKIDFHDKDEITRPIQEATEADIGKLCAFWDGNDTEVYTIGLLKEIDENDDFGRFRAKGASWWQHCRRLTKQEIEELC